MQAKIVVNLAALAVAMNAGAAVQGLNGHVAETVYANPHTGKNLVSFDWDADTNLYYSVGDASFGFGFDVYCDDGAAVTNVYSDGTVFAGSRVTVIANHLYFNDGGDFSNFTFEYYKMHLATPGAVSNLAVAGDLWGLASLDGTDLWAAGGFSASIYVSPLTAAGDLLVNPPDNLGAIGAGSGPIAFDAAGTLYYAEGYDPGDPTVYRWTAAEVASALADPVGSPLDPAGHAWATVSMGDGATGMAIDPDGHVIVTATSFGLPGELQRLFVAADGTYLGFEVLAVSPERLETVRFRHEAIHVSTAEGIFKVVPTQAMRILTQNGPGGAVGVMALRDDHTSGAWTEVLGPVPGWHVRDVDGNRVLAQAGDGGAVVVAEFDAALAPTNVVQVFPAVPGWIARALDGNHLLAQEGDGGAIAVLELDDAYVPIGQSLATPPVPGWIARDLDGARLLAQAGDGGTTVMLQMDEVPVSVTLLFEDEPTWVARSLAGDFLLVQEGSGGAAGIFELTGEAALPLRAFFVPTGLDALGMDQD